MKIVPLTAEEIRAGFSQKIELLAADVAALTSGTAFSIYPGFNGAVTASGMLVRDALLVVKTAFAFSGANNGTLAITVGDGSTANAYIASTDLKTAATPAAAFNATKPAIPAGSIINATITAATQAITALTAGEAHIYLALTACATLDR